MIESLPEQLYHPIKQVLQTINSDKFIAIICNIIGK